MAKIKRIVTSEVEGRNLSDFYADNSYSFDTDGTINYYGPNKMGPVIEPGIVYGSNADSGDGNGYNTIKLIPHAPEGFVNDDRYLIVDPTAPNHIHIRAGGQQDQSNAELILGGEKNFVKVSDAAKNVVISAQRQQQIQAALNINSQSNEYFLFTDVIPVATNGWYVEVDGVKYYAFEVTYPTEGQTQVYFPGAPLQSNAVYNLFSPEIVSDWYFDGNGTVYGPGDGGSLNVTGLNINNDVIISDVNQDNTTNINGLTNPGEAYLSFGSNGQVQIGNDGSNNLVLNSTFGNMNFWMDGAAYIGPTSSENRIAQIKDLVQYTSPTVTRWSPTFQATGLTFTGSGATYPTYNSYYIKFGQMVTFNIAVDLSTVTDFGTGQLKLELPFTPIPTAANHFSAWAWIDPTQPADNLNGHVQLVADHLQNSAILDLHWLKETTAEPKPVIESLLIQGTPVTFTTASKIYVNGTYICQ